LVGSLRKKEKKTGKAKSNGCSFVQRRYHRHNDSKNLSKKVMKNVGFEGGMRSVKKMTSIIFGWKVGRSEKKGRSG